MMMLDILIGVGMLVLCGVSAAAGYYLGRITKQ